MCAFRISDYWSRIFLPNIRFTCIFIVTLKEMLVYCGSFFTVFNTCLNIMFYFAIECVFFIVYIQCVWRVLLEMLTLKTRESRKTQTTIILKISNTETGVAVCFGIQYYTIFSFKFQTQKQLWLSALESSITYFFLCPLHFHSVCTKQAMKGLSFLYNEYGPFYVMKFQVKTNWNSRW